MATIKKYRIYCNTDSQWEYTWSETSITTCPVDPVSHSVNSNSVSAVEELSDTSVTIKEEDTPTGGHFGVETVAFDAAASTTTNYDYSCPVNYGALSVSFVPRGAQKPDGTWDANYSQEGDTFVMTASPDTNIGPITGNVKASATITAASIANPTSVTATGHGLVDGETYYISGSDSVPSIDGLRVVTVVDANTFTVPVDVTTAGTTGSVAGQTVISVAQSVIDNIKLGYYVKLADGTNTDELGRVTAIDTVNKLITVETAATNDFDMSPQTYVKMEVRLVRFFEIGPTGPYIMGESKIGASHITAGTVIRISYTNNTTTQKRVRFNLEDLY